jgi:transposase
MPKRLTVGELSGTQKRELSEFLHSRDRRLSMRARIVLLSSNGYTLPEISKLGLHYQNARNWLQRFRVSGCSGLRSRYARNGRRRVFDDGVCGKIAEVARRQPREMGMLFSVWNLRRLRDYAQGTGIVRRISIESIRQILISRDVALRKRAV